MAAFTTFLAGVLLLATVEQSRAVSLPRQAQGPILDVGYARYRGSTNPLLKCVNRRAKVNSRKLKCDQIDNMEWHSVCRSADW